MARREPALGILPLFDRDRILDPDWVVGFCHRMEALGVESLWSVEHVVVAEGYERLYPYSPSGEMPTSPTTLMPDPLEWLSFAAAVTTRIGLGTSVVVAPQHSPAILAKRAATLDALSRGRLQLGVGIGWQKEEYAACGVPYRDRGRRLDECIDAMRALWRPGPASFRGRHVRFERVHCDAKPWPGDARPQRAEGVPIVIGGSSPAAARRAGLRGNGWYPYVISPADFALRAAELRAVAAGAGRNPDEIELSVWPGSYDFAKTLDLDFVKRYAEVGIARLIVCESEAGASGRDLEAVVRLVGRYQEQILAKL